MSELRLGVQTYCFRAFTRNEDVVAAVKECGLSQVELSGVHVDVDEEAERGRVLEIYRAADIDVVGFGVVALSQDERSLRNTFQFVKEAGAQVVSVDFPYDDFKAVARLAEKLAEEFDLYLAIHNHGRRHWLGSAATLDRIFAETSDRIGLCLDTAWALDSGEDPVEMATRFRKRLYMIHLKDFVFDRAGKPSDVIVGQGNLDLPALFDLLKQTSFNHPLVLEYEGDPDDPIPSVKECVRFVKETW